MKREVQNIARHRNMVGPMRFDIGDEGSEHAHVMNIGAPPLPIEIACETFADKFKAPRRR